MHIRILRKSIERCNLPTWVLASGTSVTRPNNVNAQTETAFNSCSFKNVQLVPATIKEPSATARLASVFARLKESPVIIASVVTLPIFTTGIRQKDRVFVSHRKIIITSWIHITITSASQSSIYFYHIISNLWFFRWSRYRLSIHVQSEQKRWQPLHSD